MNFNKLKVGDRVKYKIKHGICGTNHSNFELAEGNILEIRNEYGGFFQIENNKYGGNQISVKKEDIISKLELKNMKNKIKISNSIKLNSYRIITDKIEEGINWGWSRSHKHGDNPGEDVIKEQIYNEITNVLCDIIDFD